MQCNIDQKGRTVRVITGVLTLGVGVALLVMAATGAWVGWWVWTICVVAILFGAFQVFEGAKGWCVMRALGFKTPM